MNLGPETSLLGGLVILLIVIVLFMMRWDCRRSRGAIAETEPPVSARRPEDIAPWVLEGQLLFNLWQERIERLDELKSRLSGMAQEIEQLRAEVGHIDEMRAQIARLVEEGERCRMERDHLREALIRIAGIAYEAAAEPKNPGTP
jgi:hypothetical protein